MRRAPITRGFLASTFSFNRVIPPSRFPLRCYCCYPDWVFSFCGLHAAPIFRVSLATPTDQPRTPAARILRRMQYITPFVVAMVVAVACLPLLTQIAAKWRFVDEPGGRKVHTVAIPRIGGLAMASGVLVAPLAAIDLHAEDRWFLVAAGILVIFGALDDRFDLDYRIKFVGQLLA